MLVHTITHDTELSQYVRGMRGAPFPESRPKSSSSSNNNDNNDTNMWPNRPVPTIKCFTVEFPSLASSESNRQPKRLGSRSGEMGGSGGKAEKHRA